MNESDTAVNFRLDFLPVSMCLCPVLSPLRLVSRPATRVMPRRCCFGAKATSPLPQGTLVQ